MKKYILLTTICIFYAIVPVLVIATIYVAVSFRFENITLGILITTLSFPLLFRKKVRETGLKLLSDLGNDESVNFTMLAKSTKLFSRIFLNNEDYDDLDKNLKSNLRKKNKWQGLASTENLYDYA